MTRGRMPRQKPGASKQDYSTPANFIAAVKRRLEIPHFAFDFAANQKNTKADRYWSARDNALTKTPGEWASQVGTAGDWGWLNPPFAKIDPWADHVDCAAILGAQIAFLVPAGVGANWFRDHVDGQARVLFLNGRLAFITGKPKELYPKDCVLCLYGPTIEPGYEVWSWRA